jgi:hypothetical protein
LLSPGAGRNRDAAAKEIREQIRQKYPDLTDDFNQSSDYFLLTELLN